MHDYLPIVDRDGFYTCASGGLGHGLRAAIGVALARPHEKIHLRASFCTDATGRRAASTKIPFREPSPKCSCSATSPR
jgi:hypothetical protein